MDFRSRTQLISLAEAAEMLSMSRSTMYKYVESNRIPCVKIGGRVRFSVADLETWVAARRSDCPRTATRAARTEDFDD